MNVTDDGIIAECMRGLVRGMTKLLQLQGTGGSTSVPDSWIKLREAGAVARETLQLAASEISSVPVNELKTANGAVQLPDSSQLNYTKLATLAAEILPVCHVAMRDLSEWRLIG